MMMRLTWWWKQRDIMCEMTIYVYPTTEVCGTVVVGFTPSIAMLLISP